LNDTVLRSPVESTTAKRQLWVAFGPAALYSCLDSGYRIKSGTGFAGMTGMGGEFNAPLHLHG